jgi:hypothetical protein
MSLLQLRREVPRNKLTAWLDEHVGQTVTAWVAVSDSDSDHRFVQGGVVEPSQFAPIRASVGPEAFERRRKGAVDRIFSRPPMRRPLTPALGIQAAGELQLVDDEEALYRIGDSSTLSAGGVGHVYVSSREAREFSVDFVAVAISGRAVLTVTAL